MRFDWWTLALQTVNFGILVWLLNRFLYHPVLRMIDARKTAIQKQYDDAKAVEDKALAHRAAIDVERARMTEERDAMLKAAALQAEEAAQTQRLRAEREAQTLIAAANDAIGAERERALAELRQGALDLGAEYARRLLAELTTPLGPDIWIDRVERHLAALPRQEIKALAAQLADGGVLTVATASPLSPTTEDVWRGRLRASLGEASQGETSQGVAFAIDADLIAGVELRFPTTILRFSLQSVLAALRKEIDVHGDSH